jgi:hypothetical protein
MALLVHKLPLRRPMVVLLPCGHTMRLFNKGQGVVEVKHCECAKVQEEKR